jgi:hypothetical protein
MSIFDLLGSAGAGFTKGLAQGEQAKIQLLRQQHQDKFNEQYKTDSLDLQRLRLKQDAERALKEGTDRTRDLYTKAAIAGLEFYRNTQNSADHDATVAKVGGPSSFQMQQQFQDVLQKIASGEDLGKIKFPAPKLLDKISQADTQQQLQGQEQGQPPAQASPGRPPVLDFPGLAKQITPGYTHDPLIGALNFAGGALPAEALPPQQEPPTIVQRPNPAAGLVPQPPGTAATIGLKNQQRDTAAATQAYNEARTKSEEMHQPNIVGLDTSLIGQRQASAENLRATAGATPERVQNEKTRIDNQAKADREREAQARRESARKAAMDSVDAAFKRAQTKKTLADWQKLKDGLGRVAKTVKLTPADQAEFQYLQKNATSTSKITGKVQPTPGYNERMEKFLQKLRTDPKYNTKVEGQSTGDTVQTTTPAATLPGKLSEFFPDDVSEVKRNLKNFDAWVSTLSPEAQETAKAIRGMMR